MNFFQVCNECFSFVDWRPRPQTVTVGRGRAPAYYDSTGTRNRIWGHTDPMTKATIFDVADLAGVSIKTVSRVVNSEPNVRPATKEKVDRAIARLNYRPSQAARKLASHRS